MPASRPTISVVMPAYQAQAFVAEAVASVAAQTWPAIELVAVDDGSTDATGAILDRAAGAWTGAGRRMVVLRRPNGGLGDARNAALAHATGDRVAFIDADDRWHPGLLAALAATLDADPSLDMTFPLVRYVDAEGAVVGTQRPPVKTRFDPADLLIDNPIHSDSGVLARAPALRSAGGFDPNLTGYVGLDHWVRFAALRPGNVGLTPQVLVDYRKHGGQVTSDWRRMRRNWTRLCEKAEAAGHGLGPAQRRAERSRRCLYWSKLAYDAGDFTAARALVAEAWRLDPAAMLRDRAALVRTGACLASLLPPRAHAALRRRFNAGRSPGTAVPTDDLVG